jgi:hypothetical protein
VKDACGWSYNAAGSVDFFGNDVVPVDGAGGRNWTERYRSVLSGWLLREEGEEKSRKLKPTTIMVGLLTPVR